MEKDETKDRKADPMAEPEVPTVGPGEVITLNARSYELEAPSSIAMALDLLDLVQVNERRAQAGALLLCSQKLRRICKVTPARAGHDAAAFGGMALDALVARNAPVLDVRTAGTQALLLCYQVAKHLQQIPSAAERAEGESGGGRSSS